MNHKILASFVSLSIVCPMTLLSWTELENAETDGAKMKMTFVVVDNDDNVVSNAWIQGGIHCDTGGSMGTEFAGYSDNAGRFTIAGKTTGSFVYSITKDGFYQTAAEYNFTREEDGYTPSVKDGKWQPYGQTQRVILKRIINPTATRFHYGDLPVPVNDVWIGLDLEKFMWCPPYGKGQNDDVLLRFTHNSYMTDEKVTRITMEMSFTNNPFAGAYVLKKDEWSEFESVYHANTNAEFNVTNFKFERLRTKTKRFKMESFPNDSYIVFRTRTKVDAEGKLISAHYGKIYGEWQYARYFKHGGILFNSNPNDPNLEDEESGIRARLHIKGMRERGELK